MAEEAVVSVVRDEPQRVGMLWFDNKGTLAERVGRAVRHYERKYGERVTWARVCRLDDDWEGELPQGVEVEFDNHVLPFHVWVGAGDAS
jgi:hypothetical protein